MAVGLMLFELNRVRSGTYPCLVEGFQTLLIRIQVQLSHPAIPEAGRVAVVLKFDRAGLFDSIVVGDRLVAGRAEEILTMMSENAVVDYGDVGSFESARVAG